MLSNYLIQRCLISSVFWNLFKIWTQCEVSDETIDPWYLQRLLKSQETAQPEGKSTGLRVKTRMTMLTPLPIYFHDLCVSLFIHMSCRDLAMNMNMF